MPPFELRRRASIQFLSLLALAAPFPGAAQDSKPIEWIVGYVATRLFLEDGDYIVLRGFCEREGARRIDFGDCCGTVLARAQR